MMKLLYHKRLGLNEDTESFNSYLKSHYLMMAWIWNNRVCCDRFMTLIVVTASEEDCLLKLQVLRPFALMKIKYFFRPSALQK